MSNRDVSSSSGEPTGTPHGGYGDAEYGATTGVHAGSTTRRTSTPGSAGTGSDTTDQVKQTAGNLADKVQQTAGQAGDQIQRQAGQAADKVQQVAIDQANQQLDRAAGVVADVAHAMGQVTQQLEKDNQPHLAGVTGMAAGRLNDVASYLRQQDVGQLVDDVQGFARSNPTLFLGGAFLLGFLGARFLKSSSPSSGYQTAGNVGGGRWNYQPPVYYGRRGYSGPGYAAGGYPQSPTYGAGYREPVAPSYGWTGRSESTVDYGTSTEPTGAADPGDTGTRYGGRSYGTSSGSRTTGRTRGTQRGVDYGTGTGTGDTPRTGVE